MRKIEKLVVGNWKMYPRSLTEALSKFKEIRKISFKTKKVKIVICPPSVFLNALKTSSRVTLRSLSLGAQNLFWEDEGARTGERRRQDRHYRARYRSGL